MGFAQITGGGPAGRYTVQLDYGEQTRAATVAALERQATKLDEQIAKAYAKHQAAQVEYDGYMGQYAAALSTAVELLVAAVALGNTAQLVAEAEARRVTAQAAYDDSNIVYVAASAALTSAISVEAAKASDLTAAEEELGKKEAAAAAANVPVAAAAEAVSIRRAVQSVKQASATAAEQAYAAAVASGVGVDEAREHMELTQTALSVAIQDTERAREDLKSAVEQESVATEAAATAREAARLASLEYQDAQAAVSPLIAPAQLAAANRQLARGRLDEAAAGVAAVSAAPGQESATLAAKQRVTAAQNVIGQHRSQAGPVVQQLLIRYSALKMARAQVADMIARWNAAVLIETKQVWCTDLTESGTGEVGTIDIGGETDLTLIAPGCRPWRQGDGTVSTADKTTAIDRINARLARIGSRSVATVADIADATAKETALKSALDQAHAAYAAAPAEAKQQRGVEVTAAATVYQDQIRRVRVLKARKVELDSLEVAEMLKLARWQAKPASDSPDYGDGAMVSTAIMSPEQSFFNLAILPGWQRHMPTYRWGTITALDKDNDTASVDLADATSSAQRLNINKVSSLSNVPVVYMNCNARAFEEGDNVVVQFLSQDWAKPRVIGFVSNPKPCLIYAATYNVIGNGNFSQGNQAQLARIERYTGEQWGSFNAPVPPTHYKFVRWSDGLTTLLRDDGTATENITRRAEYTFAPNFRCVYTWELEAIGSDNPYWVGQAFVRDWQVVLTGSIVYEADYLFGPEASVPAPVTLNQVLWSGQALAGANGDDVVQNLTGNYSGETSDAGPLVLPLYPGLSKSVTFVLAGSANQHQVTGTRSVDPLPGGLLPPTGSGTGEVAIIKYTASSWSATYA